MSQAELNSGNGYSHNDCVQYYLAASLALLAVLHVAYCYRRHDVAGLRLCLCVRWSRTKTAKPIEMLFGEQTRVDPRNHVLDGEHTGATWRIQLIDPCATALRHFVNYFDHLTLLDLHKN